jgi:hypothetical protein
MAAIYSLSRAGGPRSARFTAYVARVEHEWGLVGYNPMAGPPALAAVQQLITLDAEQLARNAAQEIAERCEFDGEVTLALVVASPGMWTDRLATEVQHRTVGDRHVGHGEVLLWTGDALDGALVRRESVAEAVRTMWTSTHGAATTLREVLAREGLAYALASNPYNASEPRDDIAVEDAISVLDDTAILGDIVAVLYGDAAAIALGWTPLGISKHAGFRWAIERASKLIDRVGAREALRMIPEL